MSGPPLISGGDVPALSVPYDDQAHYTPIPPPDLSVLGLISLCRRYFWPLALWVVLWVALTAIIVLGLTPLYRADALLMLDSRVAHFGNFQSVISGPLTTPDPTLVVSSEVKVLQSPDLAARVIDQLGLGDTSDFQPRPSLLSKLEDRLDPLVREILPHWMLPATWLEDAAPPTELPRLRAAQIAAYLNRLSVYTDGRSLALSLSFDSTDPQLAARVLNTHAQLYIMDQRKLKQSAGQQALKWIDTETARLSSELGAKEQQLREFRATSGLLTVPLLGGGSDATFLSRQAAQVSADLAQARAELSQREARLAQAKSAGSSGAAATETDVLGSPLIQRLREQESLAQQHLADLTQRFGNNYPDVRVAKAEVAQVGRQIGQETARILRATEGDVGLARKRVAELSAAAAKLEHLLTAQAGSAARLSEMERGISGTRQVYEGLLARRQEIAAQVGAEDADARLVATATAPLAPYYPSRKMFLGLALALSTISGVGAAYAFDRGKSGIRTPEQLQGLGVVTMHPIPLVRRTRQAPSRLPIEAPATHFAEAIRSLGNDLMLAERYKSLGVLAVTSALPREGKTTVAVSLARTMAAANFKVLLIDFDLRRPAVMQMLGVRPGPVGLVSVLKGLTSLDFAVIQDPASTLDVLAAEERIYLQGLLSSDAIRRTLDAARSRYDFVILDTPPQAAVSDILIIAPHADATVLVVRWQDTPASVVRATLQAFSARGLALSRIVLNAVNGRRLAKESGALGYVHRSTRTYYDSL